MPVITWYTHSAQYITTGLTSELSVTSKGSSLCWKLTVSNNDDLIQSAQLDSVSKMLSQVRQTLWFYYLIAIKESVVLTCGCLYGNYGWERRTTYVFVLRPSIEKTCGSHLIPYLNYRLQNIDGIVSAWFCCHGVVLQTTLCNASSLIQHWAPPSVMKWVLIGIGRSIYLLSQTLLWLCHARKINSPHL